MIIFGESAGAVVVRAILPYPSAKGLFHHAVIQSVRFEEPVFTSASSFSRAEAATEALFEKLRTRNPLELRLVDVTAFIMSSTIMFHQQDCGCIAKMESSFLIRSWGHSVYIQNDSC